MKAPALEFGVSRGFWFVALLAPGLLACGDRARLDIAEGTGPHPELPAPSRTLLPTVNIAPASAWPVDAAPTPAAGLVVNRFAHGLDHPRWLYVLPDGSVLVAETDTPPQPAKTGPMAWIEKQVMRKAGSGGRSANRITLLRDEDGDGVAETYTPFLESLNSPFGMALIGGSFFVANADAVIRYPYVIGADRITEPGQMLAPLPGGPRNHHWTKSLVASPDGRKLYVGVGSNSNIAEHGMDEETDRAAILEIDVASGTRRVFASGLRNPVGLAWEPTTGSLWTVVNERDELGSDLVPDYLTRVSDGDFFGWPYSYFGAHVDARVKPQRPDRVSTARVPDYALGPHTASLGLAYSGANALSATFHGGMFVGQHGSWNRRPHSGYKVIFVPFRDGKPQNPPVDVLGGFLNDQGQALGRPVGVSLDSRAALLVADDVGGIIWRVTASP